MDTADTLVTRQHGKQLGLSQDIFPKRILDIIRSLNKGGHTAYVVGGGVRDFLLGAKPKDFDVATSARPEQVVRLLPRCRIIGKRFRIVHVRDRREITEVSTFRAFLANTGNSIVKDGLIIKDNTYGSLEEDILRRDFTVNAMYYDPVSQDLVCHANAIADIRNRFLRSIGDPRVRYQEDPVRMLRAIRFAAKLKLRMADDVAENIHVLAASIGDVSSSRLFEESVKLFHSGAAAEAYRLLKQYGIFEILYPRVAQRIRAYDDGKSREDFLLALLGNTDERIASGKPVTPAFVLAALFWLAAEHLSRQAREGSEVLSWQHAFKLAWSQQQRQVSAPRRLIAVAREICLLQGRFGSNRKKHIHFVFNHSRFRAAYDFLCMRAASGLGDPAQADWWTRFQETDGSGRKRMLRERSNKPAKRD